MSVDGLLGRWSLSGNAVKVKSEMLAETPAGGRWAVICILLIQLLGCHIEINACLVLSWLVLSCLSVISCTLVSRELYCSAVGLSWMQRAMWARSAAVCQSVERQKVDTTTNAKQSAASDRQTDRSSLYLCSTTNEPQSTRCSVATLHLLSLIIANETTLADC